MQESEQMSGGMMNNIAEFLLGTLILWRAAGQPPGKGKVAGVCRICGCDSAGLDFDGWVRPTFTDHDKLLPGSILCHACQFSFEERSALLARLVGKEKPQRMRNYSHFIVDGVWIPLSKGNKPRMREILLNENPGLAIIAESGQKHIIFRAVPGIVQFEEQQIQNWQSLDGLLSPIEQLYTRFSKSEIREGNYAQHRVLKFGVTEWQQLESQIKSMRQSPLFALALFLAQREEIDDRVTRKGHRAFDGDMERSAGGLQEPLPGLDMATVRG